MESDVLSQVNSFKGHYKHIKVGAFLKRVFRHRRTLINIIILVSLQGNKEHLERTLQESQNNLREMIKLKQAAV